MKKLKILLLLAIVFTLVFSSVACAARLVCISHIDKDEDGKCDNCGQTMPGSFNVESISIKTMPTKMYYAMNESLDVAGGVLTVVYKDGTPIADIPFTDQSVNVAAPNMKSRGIKSVGVRHGGKTVTYEIEVGFAKYTVSYDLGYEGAAGIPSEEVTINSLATAPDDPTRDGYDFAGWYTDGNFSAVFNFNMNSIMGNTTVYARWIRKFKVTYAANYPGGANQTVDTLYGKADSSVVPSDRDGYRFAGWYTTAENTTLFNFNTDITANITIYAYWVADTVQMFTVTFNHNYGDAPIKSVTSVPNGSAVAVPADPARASVATKGHQAYGFGFDGWYTDAACTTEYDFDEDVTSDFTLYAKWTGTYIFEAEHVDLVDDDGEPLQGMGASGGAEGWDMVDSPSADSIGVNASNGYYVTYLYSYGLELKFFIESDRDIDDATLVIRISTETRGFALAPSTESSPETEAGTPVATYIMALNGKEIEYEIIEILDAQGHPATDGKRPFSDHFVAVNLSLKKGMNVFTFTSANHIGMGGTMNATAPVFDCIKVTTSANLNWNPLTSNEFGQ